MKKSILKHLAILGLAVSVPSYSYAACSVTSPNTTISSDCTDLTATTAVGNVTVNSGVTVLGNTANGGAVQVGAGSAGSYGTITNNGTINGGAAVSNSAGIYTDLNANPGTINSIINNGQITGQKYSLYLYASDPGGGQAAVGSIINNAAGVLTQTAANGSAINLGGSGTVNSISNAGSIGSTALGALGIRVGSLVTVKSLTNTNEIFGTGVGTGILAAGAITTLENSGTIAGGNNASGIVVNGVDGLITTLTNTATGAGISGGNFSISNTTGGTIVTLNNAQSSLTYTGKLPTNYNIIVNSPSSYGQLSVTSPTSTTNFGIYGSSTITKGTYINAITGVTAANLSTSSGSFNGTAWHLALQSGSTILWDLIVESSATNTAKSIQMNANGLSTVYNQQVAAYQAALSYDCTRYDTNNLCVSVGGRYTYAGPAPSANSEAGLVVLGYRPTQTLRVGGFVDQSVNVSTPTGFSQSKTSPMWGFFGKWNLNKDGNGLGVQASLVTSASKLSVTRTQLENTEAGQGNTQFNGQGYQLTTNYHQPVTDHTKLVPYVGLRYTRVNAGAYTENATANVTSPLSYNAMAQNTFSAIAGLGVNSHLAEKLTGTASVGIQQNLNYNMANYQGTSNITGLQSFSVQMPGNVNSMATATAGLYYDIRKNERVGVNVLWQQQPFIATNTTTALAIYTIGF